LNLIELPAWPWTDISSLLILFYSLFQLLGIVSALEAIMKTRTSTGAIAWSLSLVLMPLLMVPAWWVFGRRKFRGYAKARRSGRPARRFGRKRAAERRNEEAAHTDIQQLATALLQKLSPFRPTATDTALETLERVAQLPATAGNSAQLLIDGDAAFSALFEAIDRAEHYILLEYYILRHDTVGTRLRERLQEKARAGVRIYFLYDEIGSFQLSRSYLTELRAAGVDIRSFHTTKGRRNRFQVNFRNHRKILVVDGRFAMIGGINIGDEYLGHHPRLTPWRDTNVALRGPSVQGVQLAFLEDWYWACEEVPELEWEPQAAATPGSNLLVAATGPADSLETCVLYFIQLINSARERLWIVSPYFVPDAALVAALQLAALRGVDVRILLPERADKWLMYLAAFAYFDEVQAAGVRLFRYQAGFLHQKVWLVDDLCATVGTANLDNRSCRLNFEIGALVHDNAFCRAVEQMLEADFARSRELPHGQLARRRLPFRLAVRLAHLFAPVL
jgi:cardiolipin synthase